MKDKPPSLGKIEMEVLSLIKKAREERKARGMQAQLKKVARKVFNPETRGGRIARTALQAFIGLTTFIGGVFAIPELYAWFESLPLIVQLGGLAGAVTAVSAVQNYAKSLWEWVK